MSACLPGQPHWWRLRPPSLFVVRGYCRRCLARRRWSDDLPPRTFTANATRTSAQRAFDSRRREYVPITSSLAR